VDHFRDPFTCDWTMIRVADLVIDECHTDSFQSPFMSHCNGFLPE